MQHHLGMEVYGYDPYISVDAAWKLSRTISNIIANVDEIYKDCDYITIHVPLLDSTKGMIDKEALVNDERRRCDSELFKRSSGG